MKPLHVSDADEGQLVLYSGDRDSSNVFDPERRRRGHVLEHHHPDVVDRFYGPGKHHCIVRFFGSQDEPVSTGVGFDAVGGGHYPDLLCVTNAEWAQALSAGWWSQVG